MWPSVAHRPPEVQFLIAQLAEGLWAETDFGFCAAFYENVLLEADGADEAFQYAGHCLATVIAQEYAWSQRGASVL